MTVSNIEMINFVKKLDSEIDCLTEKLGIEYSEEHMNNKKYFKECLKDIESKTRNHRQFLLGLIHELRTLKKGIEDTVKRRANA